MKMKIIKAVFAVTVLAATWLIGSQLYGQFKPLKVYYISVPVPNGRFGLTELKIVGDDPADAIRRAGIVAYDERTRQGTCRSMRALNLDCDAFPMIDLSRMPIGTPASKQY